jgi:hypothetical protein
MKRTISAGGLFLLAALAGLAAPAAAQQKGKPVNPVGDFEYTTTANGQTVSGLITITKKDDVLSGKISSDMMPEFPISAVKVEDRKVTMTATLPDNQGEITIVLTFEDDDKFAGNWSSADGQGGTISGKRKPG